MEDMYFNTEWKALPNVQKHEFIEVFMQGYSQNNSILTTSVR